MTKEHGSLDLAARLDWLEARARIADLVHRYALSVRDGDLEACLALFAEHARFEVLSTIGTGQSAPQASVAGKVQVRAFLKESFDAKSDLTPLVHNLVIDVDGDRATSRCVMIGTRHDGSPIFLGSYADEFRRSGEWLFISRQYTITGQQS